MLPLLPIALASALAFVSLGGGLYEFLVVDPAWPRRPDLIQPDAGGISRRRFWIPAHVAFELALIVSLILAWSQYEVRVALLAAAASHGTMRLWSAFDFIPKALAFERADPAAITEPVARAWTRRSRFRFSAGSRHLRSDTRRPRRGGAAWLTESRSWWPAWASRSAAWARRACSSARPSPGGSGSTPAISSAST